MYRRITKTAIVLALAVFVVLGTTFTASAEPQYIFNMPIAQPQIGDDIAYVEVLYQRNGVSRIDAEVLIIHLAERNYFDYSEISEPSINLYIDSNRYLYIMPHSFYLEHSPVINCFYYSSLNNSGFLYESEEPRMQIDYSNILGIHIYGDVQLTNEESYFGNFTFNYGFDSLAYGQLNTIISILRNQTNADIIENNNKNTQTIITEDGKNTDKITDNQDSNTDKITDNQNQNTQDIIDNQNQIVENEKQEVTGSGNSSVDSIMNIIPDVGTDGIISGINKIISSISDESGSPCSIEFPSLRIPKIDGVITNEIVLTNPYKIDLYYWVTKIPYKIITVVRCITTIGIILFVVFELYNLILFCMTLKSGQGGKEDDEE